ncbi:MAG TPA: hypothetical protein VJ276_16815 [Thermoanaerobaculia bacterium]|nr:hypothetical protein [Thermoanaerobaculia bacterium]
MKSLSVFAVKLAGIASLTFLLSASAFADSRHQDQTWRSGADAGRHQQRYDDNDVLRGVVNRVDFRRSTVWLREDRTGRLIEVDLRGERRGRLDIRDLRRGDRVELSGDWLRGGVFAANRIDGVRNGRY